MGIIGKDFKYKKIDNILNENLVNFFKEYCKFKHQFDNTAMLPGNYNDYVIKLHRDKDFSGLRISKLLNYLDAESITPLDGDRLEVKKIME